MSERPSFLPEQFGNVGRLNFQEIRAPEAVSMGIETPAWYVLFGLIALCLLTLAWWAWRRRRRNRYRRQALKRLRSAGIAEVPGLLKAVAMGAYGRRQVASLCGAPWHAFLAQTCPGGFDPAAAKAMDAISFGGSGAGGGAGAGDPDALVAAAGRWIRHHRVPPRRASGRSSTPSPSAPPQGQGRADV